MFDNGLRHTRKSVQSPLVELKALIQKVLICLQKVRKGGDFFYGKSGHENHIEGIRSSAGRSVSRKNYRNCKEDRRSGQRPCTTSDKEGSNYNS